MSSANRNPTGSHAKPHVIVRDVEIELRLAREELEQLKQELKQIRGDNQLIKNGLIARDEKLLMVATLGVKAAKVLQMFNLNDLDLADNNLSETMDNDLYLVEKEFEGKIDLRNDIKRESRVSLPIPSSDGSLSNAKAAAKSSKELEQMAKQMSEIIQRFGKLSSKVDTSYVEFKRFKESVQSTQEPRQRTISQSLTGTSMREDDQPQDNSQDPLISSVDPRLVMSRVEVESLITAMEQRVESGYLKKQLLAAELKKQRNLSEDFFEKQFASKIDQIGVSNRTFAANFESIKKVLYTKADLTSFEGLAVKNKAVETSLLALKGVFNSQDEKMAEFGEDLKYCKAKVRDFEKRLDEFKEFLKKTDETILFKAQRMDVEVLEKNILENYASKVNTQDQFTHIQEQLRNSSEEIKAILSQTCKETGEMMRDEIWSIINSEIPTQVHAILERLKILTLEGQIHQLAQQVTTKAAIVDVCLLRDECVSREVVERVSLFIRMFHKHFKQHSHQTIQFLQSFLDIVEVESIGPRHAEMTKILSDLSAIFQIANTLSLGGSVNGMRVNDGGGSGGRSSRSPPKNSSLARDLADPVGQFRLSPKARKNSAGSGNDSRMLPKSASQKQSTLKVIQSFQTPGNSFTPQTSVELAGQVITQPPRQRASSQSQVHRVLPLSFLKQSRTSKLAQQRQTFSSLSNYENDGVLEYDYDCLLSNKSASNQPMIKYDVKHQQNFADMYQMQGGKKQ